jgi:hypothetical protein
VFVVDGICRRARSSYIYILHHHHPFVRRLVTVRQGKWKKKVMKALGKCWFLSLTWKFIGLSIRFSSWFVQ